MKRIQVKAKPNSRHEGVEELGPDVYLVRVKDPPTEGKANTRVIELLARHFDVPKSKVTLKSGPKSKTKIFIINTD